MKIDFVRFSNSAIPPAKGTEDSAGFDLYSVECVTIPSNSIKFIKTDLALRSLVDILEKFTQGPVWQSIDIEQGKRFAKLCFKKLPIILF